MATATSDICLICGSEDRGIMRCPADLFSKEVALQYYGDFLDSYREFDILNALPVNLKIEKETTAADYFTEKAKWHKACRLKFATSKLQRKRQRSRSEPRNYQTRKPRSTIETSDFSKKCLFCNDSQGLLHACSTFTLDKSIKDMACEIKDTELLSRIAGSDLIAIEAHYHNNCLRAYKNKHRDYLEKLSEREKHDCEPRIFAELISYIESSVKEDTYIFKLFDLHSLYTERQRSFGIETPINKTRLKKKILEHFKTECQEQNDGKTVILVFNKGLRSLLKGAIESSNLDKEAFEMVSVSKRIRKDMSEQEPFIFNGSFPTNCEDNSIPPELKALISMLLYGSNIKDQTINNSKECLTICQLIQLNSKFRSPVSDNNFRHCKNREPPLPLYIGLYIHTLTRSKKLITQFNELGISVNYQRIIQVENSITSAACKRYEEDDLVCPTQLRDQLFTVGALDNLDHNPSATTSQGSFHGTSISVLQFPTSTNLGICREPLIVPPTTSKRVPSLPDNYCIVPAVSCNINTEVPETTLHEVNGNIEGALEGESNWIQQSIPLLAKPQLEKDDYVSWNGFHASQQQPKVDPPGISSLLPLFEEKSATVAMVKHGMSIIKRITEKCNPGQVPVIAVDQPLYALAKSVQWKWSESFGEGSYVVMLGGLHIEIALWKMMGKLLNESGWTNALVEAGVAGAGTADSFIKVHHVTKTRHAHQVTALTLAKLQQDAYLSDDDTTFEQWKNKQMEEHPMFKYWDLVLSLQIRILIFVRSHRERNLSLYIQVLDILIPWLFALDRTHYSRWLPVHTRDLKSLPESLQEQFEEFWVFPKTQRNFSCMPLDQAHEQNNKIVKESGGAVGLTENPVAFRRWMISGPEQARLLQEFENGKQSDNTEFKSHEQVPSIQNTFKLQVNNMCETISTMGNPFLDDTNELMHLQSHDYVNEDVVKSLYTMEQLGIEQHTSYVENVLINRTESIHASISRNKLPLFKKSNAKCKDKLKQKAEDVKKDYGLFSQLFISCQVRQGDLDDFFSRENHPWPPSLSQGGLLRLPTCKSELLECLGPSCQYDPPEFDAKIFDGAAIVHALPKGDSSTFGEYCDLVFIPWTKRQLETSKRIDIVWDTYKHNSLKEFTRKKRGIGIRRKVSSKAKIPSNFASFLRDDTNKQELYSLLTESVATNQYQSGKEVYITQEDSVISVGSNAQMSRCDHEEADSRLCIHILDAAKKGANSIMVRTVDTDVIVILVGIYFDLLATHPALQLWVAFGNGKHFRYYHINAICGSLGISKSRALPFFHAFSGSDTTSQFAGKGKKSSWKAWKSIPQATEGFLFPVLYPFTPITDFNVLERFTCVLYDNTTIQYDINQLRKELFATSKVAKLMEYLPPTRDALKHHVNRSLYQASIWLSSLNPLQNAPSPENFGWSRKDDNSWQPTWTTSTETMNSTNVLIKCGCISEPLCSSKKCSCKRAELKCTALCQCAGKCE